MVADLHREDKNGNTPLYSGARGLRINFDASTKISIESCEILMKAGADPNLKNKLRQTPLELSPFDPKPKLIKLFLEYGTSPNISVDRKFGLLGKIIELDKLEFAHWLIEYGADVNFVDKLGWVPLHYAARKGNKKIVEKLIEKEADIHRKNNKGQTPLTLAKLNRKDNLTSLLNK